MRIYGVDFTSAPSRTKAITLAECSFGEGRLRLSDLLRLSTFERFERSLDHPGPWVAGMDFPFGLPRRLVEALSWPADWSAYVARAAEMGRGAFEDLLLMYKAAQPAGDKEHRRAADVRAGALSPMKLSGTPLAKMFFEGAPRLARSRLNVVPCRPTDDPRTVIEAYPALVARHLIGRRSYKDESGKATQARHNARRDIVGALCSSRVAEVYGFSVEMGHFLADGLVRDAGGDLLDAVLAAVQAAWAYGQRWQGFGIPRGCDALEGWIPDPGTRVDVAD